ncbi:MAG: type I restriction endonuclease subunit R [Thermoguttaceae bacterium]|nr:type I restriction endonuclease subunit R [Thermoguttaceae bacterium]
MPTTITEETYEKAILELFADRLGYERRYGPEVERDYERPYYEPSVRAALERLNPGLPQAALDDAFFRIAHIDDGTLLQRNQRFTDYLQNGVPVSFNDGGETRSDLVRLVDYDNSDKNDFVVVNQWTCVEKKVEKRPDVVVLLNGFPVAIFELKSPSRENTDASEAFLQLRNYMSDISELFVYNQICVMSDMAVSKAGTISSGEDRYMAWKSVDGEKIDSTCGSFDVFFEGIFRKSRFLDVLKNFICFNEDVQNPFKILAGYHQYFAVNKAIDRAVLASQSDGRGGVFWHTQGSGKSLSMVFFAHGIQRRLDNPTIVVLTDRNDIDDQLYEQFCRCKDFLRQTPVQATGRENLRELLDKREAGGIVFSTMQKFDEYDSPLSERRNIVVMADEAHRSQYGLQEKNKRVANEDGSFEYHKVVGAARLVRDSLPNATYVGFTGTPIAQKDHNTREVFGDYIDVYDMTQAVEDGATRPVFYESRVVKLKLKKEVLDAIDREYEKFAETTEPWVLEKSKRELGTLDELLGTDDVLDSLVADILDHYENYRANELAGKAMIVAYSRKIAIKIYKRILAARPGWFDKVAVVMTGSNQDPEEWKEIVGTKARKDELARLFKDDKSPLKIAIVVDMWLTGFDVPSLATMYVYKPMSGHNLMQAIARVNRVYKDKEGGLIVDYVGLMSALKNAMRDYTRRDRENFDEMDIADKALDEFNNKLEVCEQLLRECDAFQNYATESNLTLTKSIVAAVDFILGKEPLEKDKPNEQKTRYLFTREATALKQAYSLCSSIVEKDARLKQAFIDAVRVQLLKLAASGAGRKTSLKEINEQIAELVRQSVESEGVVNLFKSRGAEFSIFDPKFLAEIARMKQKNLAIELLKRLLNDQIRVFERSNLVKSKKFSEQFQEAMNRYINGLITNEEVIQELLNIAGEVAKAGEEGRELGLTDEELAFYDAISTPKGVRDFYEHDVLIQLTRELTDALRKSRTIDWEKKESARAEMRIMIKRLLKKYKYPPEGMDEARDLVIEQCELWAENGVD